MSAQAMAWATVFRMLAKLSAMVAALFEARSGRGVQDPRWWDERAQELRAQAEEAKRAIDPVAGTTPTETRG